MSHTPKSIIMARNGYNTQEVMAVMTNAWDITEETRRKYRIHIYYVRKWGCGFVRNEIHDGIITHDGIPYCVIYRSCTPASLKQAKYVHVSFRAGDFGNFALIQPASPSYSLLG